MALTRCPSCKASVLDEDATECPFCGAPMDGGKPSAAAVADVPVAAPEKPKPKPKKAVRTSELGDPIDLAPRPSKGRMERVVCPMCDTAGFAPEDVAGKPVRCMKPGCAVPVFVVPRRAAPTTAAAPKKASNRGAIVIAAVTGTLIVGAIGGLVAFLQIEQIEEEPVDDGGTIVTPVDPVSDRDPVVVLDGSGGEDPIAESEFDRAGYESARDDALDRIAALTRAVRARGLIPAVRRDAAVALFRAGRLDAAAEQVAALRESGPPAFLVEPLAAGTRFGSADATAEAVDLVGAITPRGLDGVGAAVAAATLPGVDAASAWRIVASVVDDEAARFELIRLRAAVGFGFDASPALRSEPIGGAVAPVAVAGLWELAVAGGGREELERWCGTVDAEAAAEVRAALAEWLLVTGAGSVEELSGLDLGGPVGTIGATARAAYAASLAGRDAEGAAALRAASSVTAPEPSPAEADLSIGGVYRAPPSPAEGAISAAKALGELARAHAAAGDAASAAAALEKAIALARTAGPSPRATEGLSREFAADRGGVEVTLGETLGIGSTDGLRNAANRYRRHLREAEAASATRRELQLTLLEAVAGFDAAAAVVTAALDAAEEELFDAGDVAWRTARLRRAAGDDDASRGRVPAVGRLAIDVDAAIAAGDARAAAEAVDSAPAEAVGEYVITRAALRAAFEILAAEGFDAAKAFANDLDDPVRRIAIVTQVAARQTYLGPSDAAEAFVFDRNVDPATKFAACIGIRAAAEARLREAGTAGAAE